jgi:hypothetical protein
MKFLFAFLLPLGIMLVAPAISISAQPASDRFPYEHVLRVTAGLEFDGERIEVDDLIDCRSHYQGPATRAVQLPFDASRSQFPYPTADGGVLIINVMPNVCATYADIWADLPDKTIRFPAAWLPFMHWYDNRNLHEAVHGEYYWSAAALDDPDGRLKVVEGFRITYPDQTEALVEEAARQAVDRDIWQGGKRGFGSAIYLKRLPVYYRIPREIWSQPPEYRGAPDRPSDFAGLRDYLDAIPSGTGMMFLGEQLSRDRDVGTNGTVWRGELRNRNDIFQFTIGDLMWGTRGGTTEDAHGIPQRDEPRWGMFLSDRYWRSVQIDKRQVPFRDNLVPLAYSDGALVLRTYKTGLAFLFGGYGDWYRETERDVEFLGKPFVNGPYSLQKGWLLLDLETRDLWVRV